MPSARCPGEFTRTLKDRKIIMTRRQHILSSAVALCLGSGLLQAAVGPPAASYLRFFEVERKSLGDHPPLNGAAGVAVSADGRNVYATGGSSPRGAPRRLGGDRSRG